MMEGAAINPDAHPTGFGFCPNSCAGCDIVGTDHTQFYGLPVSCDRKISEEMRRYLYRNVACEARKLSDIARHIPDVRGWA